MKKEVYLIEGMHCAACSSSIERVTRKIDGVFSSDVNLPMNRMTIVYDEEKVTPEMITGKIEKAGFGAKLYTKDREKTEAKAVDEEAAAEEETRKNIIGAVIFTVLLMYVSMGHMIRLPLPSFLDMHQYPYNYAVTQMLLAIPVLYFGRNFFIGGYKSLFHLNPNMDTLVAVGSTASFLYSLVLTYSLVGTPSNVHTLYFESSACVITFVMFGKYLESRNKVKTKSAITALIGLQSDTAFLVDDDDTVTEVGVDELKKGDILQVRPGERIPLDGVLVSGTTTADESMLTGESMPVEKEKGSELTGGSINISGLIRMRVTRTGDDTTLSQIIRFVEDAQGKKAPIAKIADKVAGIFVPAVMSVALLTAVIWTFAGKDAAFIMKVFVSVLVIACPCALGLATPCAIIVGTGLGASKGILIRNGETLEVTHKADTVVLDKTGTVTEGRPSVTDIFTDGDETDLLRAAASVEDGSTHPLGQAVIAKAEEMGIDDFYNFEEFEELPGRGLTAVIDDGRRIYAGSRRYLDEKGISSGRFESEAEKCSSVGKSLIYVVAENELIGLIAVADTVKDTSTEAVAAFREMGMKTVLLTGDNMRSAEYISSIVGTDECIADVLPQDKAEVIRRLQQEGRKVIMVGDGINDAVALTQADVGVAVGSGSDIAVESADIVLMKNDLKDVVKAVNLSKYTIRTIKENLFWAFCYNTIGIPIAAGALYPVNGLLLSPMIGALCMSLSSVTVVSNALRLRFRKL